MRSTISSFPFDVPADLDTPVSAFRKLAPFRPRYLLESVEGGERLGRYSFLGFGDALEVRLEDGVLAVGGDRAPAADGAALLDALRAALARAPRPRAGEAKLPFSGGLVGAAAFELARRFVRVRDPRHALVGPELALVATRSVLVFDHVARRVAVLHDGDEVERASLRREVLAALRGPLAPVRVRARIGTPKASMDDATLTRAIERAQDHIRAGDVFQLVLSLAHEGEAELDPFEVYRALRLTNPSPYSFFCDLGDVQLAGSSPEALVRLEGRTAHLRPIAGTRRRGETPVADEALARELLADDKEHAEHVMLVDLARNDAGRVAEIGSVVVEPYRTVERYSHVMHTVSGVRATLAEGKDGFDLFAAAFPAGTVSGAPKARALELIDALEPSARGFYAGTVGYFGHGAACDHALTIRSIALSRGRYRYQAGAGIVEASRPAAEIAEMRAKAAVMEGAMRLVEEGL
ncbi:MAG: anthranilate synthase component I family protein [Sandaracinus sp.]